MFNFGIAGIRWQSVIWCVSSKVSKMYEVRFLSNYIMFFLELHDTDQEPIILIPFTPGYKELAA